jgi:hypothetical protein
MLPSEKSAELSHNFSADLGRILASLLDFFAGDDAAPGATVAKHGSALVTDSGRYAPPLPGTARRA